MTTTPPVELIYSPLFQLIASLKMHGWCLHLICLNGRGVFSLNDSVFSICKNDAVIIHTPELVKIIEQSEDLQVEVLAAKLDFLRGLLPVNNYGTGGGISLFSNPVMHLSDTQARTLIKDMRRIRDRANETHHRFYHEMIGSLLCTMIYDFFDFHAQSNATIYATDRSLYVVKTLIAMLESAASRQHRDITYYAQQMHVSPKYLSDTVKRLTGKSVTYFIDRYTSNMVKDYLNNTELTAAEIAERMHFKSLSYFSRYVKKHLGASPRQYRKALLPQNIVNSSLKS